MNGEMTYDGLIQAMRRQDIAYTVEFYPEEGKYHHSGHRACHVKMSPEELREQGEICRIVWTPDHVGRVVPRRAAGWEAGGYVGWR